MKTPNKPMQRTGASAPVADLYRWPDGRVNMRSVAFILAAFGLLGSVGVGAESQISVCSAHLSLRLHAEETRVVEGGALTFAVEIRNGGKEPCWLYGDLSPSVWLHIYDASGSEVQPRVLFEHLPPPPRKTDFLQLLPDHSLTLHDRYAAKELGLAPGRYIAKVEFKFVPANEALGIPACTGWLRTPDAVPFEVVK